MYKLITKNSFACHFIFDMIISLPYRFEVRNCFRTKLESETQICDSVNNMQSTKDESSWEGRIGGGFVRLHHSINQKKRFFTQNGVEDESNIQDWPTSLSFSATKDGYSLPLANKHFNNRVGYNMQFLRHDANQISYKKWGDQEEWTDGIGDSNNIHHSVQDDVRSSYVSSFW